MSDTREQVPYTFESIPADPIHPKGTLLHVPIRRLALPRGDYQVFGFPSWSVERKSLADLYASIGRRENWIGRLQAMSEHDGGAVVVEAELSTIMSRPPPFTKIRPKTVSRTVQAWSQRYPKVSWWFLPGREWGEAWTFRLLERWWKDRVAG